MGVDSFHTIRYDFKPVSVDSNKEGTIEFGEGNQVTVTAPNSEGSGHPESVFTGSRKPHMKECILIIDHETGEITIEKLSHQITVKQTRMEPKGPSGLVPRPATPVSDGGSVKKNSPRGSSHNHHHNSNSGTNHRSSAAGGGKSPISPPTPSSSLSSHSSQNNNNNNRIAKSSPNLSSPAITTSHFDDVSVLSESSSDEDDGRRSHTAYASNTSGSVSKSPIHSRTFEKDGQPMSSSSSSSSSASSDEDEDNEDERSDPLSLNGSKATNSTLPPTPSDVKMSSSDADSSDDEDRRGESEEEGEIRKRNGTVNGKSGSASAAASRNNDASAQNNSAPVLSMPQFNLLTDDLCLSESGSDDDDN